MIAVYCLDNREARLNGLNTATENDRRLRITAYSDTLLSSSLLFLSALRGYGSSSVCMLLKTKSFRLNIYSSN